MILHIPQTQSLQFEMIPLCEIEHRKEAHRHDFYVLVYVQSGSGIQFIDYESIEVVPNRVHLISPQQVHLWQANCEGYSIVIYPDYLPNEVNLLEKLFMNFDKTSYIDIPKKEQKHLNMLLSILAQKYQEKHASNTTLRSFLGSFLHYCLELKEKDTLLLNSLEKSRLLKINQLIEKHFKKDLSVEAYAKRLELSPQHLNRLLKQQTGKTLIQLIRERKIVEAKRELIFSSYSIDQIAESLGYFDNSNFSKFFKKHSTHSPSEFREKFKNYH